jgi:hypothetical protein
VQDLAAEDLCVRGAAVDTPEAGAARGGASPAQPRETSLGHHFERG